MTSPQLQAAAYDVLYVMGSHQIQDDRDRQVFSMRLPRAGGSSTATAVQKT